MTMAKITEELLNVPSSSEDDVLENIQPEDYVFVVGPRGQLRGISLPTDDDQEVSPEVEEIFKFFVNKENSYLASQTIH